MFVTGKLDSLTVGYETHSESARFRECFGAFLPFESA